jgi:hypothetical protein
MPPGYENPTFQGCNSNGRVGRNLNLISFVSNADGTVPDRIVSVSNDDGAVPDRIASVSNDDEAVPDRIASVSIADEGNQIQIPTGTTI